jgi:hypothetical protein
MLAVAKCQSQGYPAVRILARPHLLPGFLCEALRAASFISCLTPAHVPSASPQALHEMMISLVGCWGICSRPPHFLQLNTGASLPTAIRISEPIRATHRATKSRG